MKKAWALKLGSEGRCVPFCEKHHIVGVGWKEIDFKTVSNASKEALRKHVQERHRSQSPAAVGRWTGALYRFSNEVKRNDYILYYDPNSKHVRVCKVTSGLKRRDFDLSARDKNGHEVDIWLCRDITIVADVSILDLDGVLKGKVLGPRGHMLGAE